jgi:hypothetical protein
MAAPTPVYHEKLHKCRHVHASGRRCQVRLPVRWYCQAHAGQACQECASMLGAFPRSDGKPWHYQGGR